MTVLRSWEFKENISPAKGVFAASVLTLALFIIIPGFNYTDAFNAKKTRKVALMELPEEKEPEKRMKPRKKQKRIEADRTFMPDTARKLSPLKIDVTIPVDFRSGLSGMSFDYNFSAPVSMELENLVFEIRDVDSPPVATVTVPPQYPAIARQRGIEATVNISFIVNENGEVEEPVVMQRVADGVFDRSAIRSVSSWKFKPGIKNGKNVRVRVEIPLRFTLQ